MNTFLSLIFLFFLIGCMSEVQVETYSNSGLVFMTKDLDQAASFPVGATKNFEIDLINNTDESINFSITGVGEHYSVLSDCSLKIGAKTKCRLEVQFLSPGGVQSHSSNIKIEYVEEGELKQKSLILKAKASPINGIISNLYSGQGSWHSYIKSNNGKEFNASANLACDGTELSALDCLHAGEMKTVEITSLNSCDDVQAQDSLEAFEWGCFSTGNSIKIYSKLKGHKGLKDLVNSSSWKDNSLSVTRDGFLLLETASTKWWNDIITPYSLQGSVQNFNTPNMIYTISAGGLYGGFLITADHVNIVGLGVSVPLYITYSANSVCDGSGQAGTLDCLIAVPDGGVKYSWVENLEIDGINSNNYGLLLSGSQFSTFKTIMVNSFTSSRSIDLGSSGTPSSYLNRFYNVILIGNGPGAFRINHANSHGNFIKDLDIHGGSGRGVELSNAPRTIFDGLFISGLESDAFRLQSAANETKIKHFDITSNEGAGLLIADSDDVSFYDGNIANNLGTGISVTGSSQRTVGNQFKISNCDTCLNISVSSGTQESIFNQFIITGASSGTGAIIYSGYKANFSHFLIGNNSGDGIYTISSRAPDYVFSQGLFVNNGGQAYEGDSAVQTSIWANVGFVGNGSHGFFNNFGSFAFFTGQIIFGNNSGSNCSGGQSVTNNCTSSGLDGSNDWNSSAIGSNARLRINHSLADSFFGSVSVDSKNNSPLLVDVQDGISDWSSFESVFRLWGLAGVNSDSIQVDQRGECTGGGVLCRIWDWRLVSNAADSVLFNRSGNNTAGDQENEPFVGDGVTPCPSAVHGDRVMNNLFTISRVYLLNALEILDDDIGNNDGLCESSEACIYSPNIGPYQGEGNYLSNGTCLFVDGVGANSVTGVTMYAFPINGAN